MENISLKFYYKIDIPIIKNIKSLFYYKNLLKKTLINLNKKSFSISSYRTSRKSNFINSKYLSKHL